MKRGEFIINGTNSNELKSLIQYRPEIATPQRKVDMRSAPGVDGDYIFDEEAYENTSFSLELFTKGKDEEEINYLKELIAYTFDSGDYIEFIPYWDKDMVYQVKATSGPNYTPDGQTPLLLSYTVTLSVKPFKHYRESIKAKGVYWDKTENPTMERIGHNEGTSSIIVYNPTLYDSEPLITLYGTGDMNLVVNGENYVFQDIDTDIIVDSQIESAYRMIAGKPESRDNRMYTMDFPKLEPGGNAIEVTGNATEFKVEPRWRKLVS